MKITDCWLQSSRIAQSGDNGLADREMIADLLKLGIDFYQFHYPADITPRSTLQEWSSILGSEKLWLAPRIAPDQSFDEDACPWPTPGF